MSLFPDHLRSNAVPTGEQRYVRDVIGPPEFQVRKNRALVALLLVGMVAASYLQGALSVLSGFVISELSISRSQFGIAFATVSLVGAVVSPLMGAVTDRNVRGSMLLLFVVAASGVLIASVASTFGFLLVASVVAGIGLATANPVTNRVIAEWISRPRRGIVVGLKSAGPPLSLLLAGLILPSLAARIGWRSALAATAFFPLLALIATRVVIPTLGMTLDKGRDDGRSVQPVVVWLTVTGLGFSAGMSVLIAFIPLFAQEELGLSASQAGWMAALMGLAGVSGRVFWGYFGGRSSQPATVLLVISAVSGVATVLLLGATLFGPMLLWIGALVAGGSLLSWHALAWLVIISRVTTTRVGRASGVMNVGSTIGFALGPPLAGAMLDATGSYRMVWISVSALLVILTALSWLVRSRVEDSARKNDMYRGSI